MDHRRTSKASDPSSQPPRSRRTVRRGAVITECRTLNLQSTQTSALLAPRDSSLQIHSSITAHLNPSFFLEFLQEYEEYVYPMRPVIPAAEVREMVTQVSDIREAASFVYIFAAVTLNLTRNEPVQEAPVTRERIAARLSRSLEYRHRLRIDEQQTIVTVMSSLFTEMCCIGLRRLDLGFLYLREVISLLYMLHAHSKKALVALDLPERARLQRAYWECFIHERFIALTYKHPPCLSPLETLPDHDESLPADVESGFNHIIKIFCLVDRQFLDFWLGDRSGMTAEWVEKKQRQLEDNCEVLQLPPCSRWT